MEEALYRARLKVNKNVAMLQFPNELLVELMIHMSPEQHRWPRSVFTSPLKDRQRRLPVAEKIPAGLPRSRSGARGGRR